MRLVTWCAILRGLRCVKFASPPSLPPTFVPHTNQGASYSGSRLTLRSCAHFRPSKPRRASPQLDTMMSSGCSARSPRLSRPRAFTDIPCRCNRCTGASQIAPAGSSLSSSRRPWYRHCSWHSVCPCRHTTRYIHEQFASVAAKGMSGDGSSRCTARCKCS
jgi:hypothetical protein